MWYKISVPLHPYACGYLAFPTSFVENNVLFLLTIIKNNFTVFMRVYFWALYSVQLVYMSVLMPLLHCFNYCSFMVSLEIKECEAPNYVLFQDYLTIWGTLRIQINFRIDFSIWEKKPILGF